MGSYKGKSRPAPTDQSDADRDDSKQTAVVITVGSLPGRREVKRRLEGHAILL
jgi:hypothetical protein